MTTKMEAESKDPAIAMQLESRIVQIQTASLPGDTNSGPHIQIHALCEDGSVWVKYSSSGFSNVPTDGAWHQVNEKARTPLTDYPFHKDVPTCPECDQEFEPDWNRGYARINCVCGITFEAKRHVVSLQLENHS